MKQDKKIGIVLCSRVRSKRLLEKPLQKINGKTLIRLLIERLLKADIPICVALPDNKEDDKIADEICDLKIDIYRGEEKNVLKRFYLAAKKNNFDIVIRVTHDDILIDTDMMMDMIQYHQMEHADYTYPVHCIDGTGTEAVNIELIEKALPNYLEIEHLSYAFKKYAQKICRYEPLMKISNDIRLTIDYPEDLQVMQCVYDVIGYEDFDISTLAIHVESTLSHIGQFNRQPKITVYTCVYNNEDTIDRAVESVQSQTFGDYEYIICDDKSMDSTRDHLWDYNDDPKIKYVINEENIGLAASCNKVLEQAKGKYYVRLDADDEFYNNFSLEKLYNAIEQNDSVICYSAYCEDNNNNTVKQNISHHIGGAIVQARAYQELKFNENFRHWDGYDFYLRAKEKFSVGYIEEPIWIYHNRENSLSRSKKNIKERNRIKQIIDYGAAP